MVKDTLNRVAITLLDLNEFTEKVDLEGHHVKVIGDGRFSIAGYAIDNKKVLEYYLDSWDGLFSFFPFTERDFQLEEGEVLSFRFSVDKESPLITYKKPSKVDVDEFFRMEDIYVTKAGDYFIKHTEHVDNKVINVLL